MNETRKLSPGWRPLPRPQRPAGSPGRSSPLLSPLGRPGTRRTWPPTPLWGPPPALTAVSGTCRARRTARKLSWATPWGGFYTPGRRALGSDGPEDQLCWEAAAARPRPRLVRDFGATSEAQEGPDFCGTCARDPPCVQSRATPVRRLIQQRALLPT